MLDPRIIGGLILGWLLTLLAAYGFGHTKGYAAAEIACAKADASANATAITEWKAAVKAQQQEDATHRAADLKAQADATAALNTLQDRWMTMKLAVVKQAPPAKCDLSPAWVSAWNQGVTP
ncbi:MAG TPA: hypothetical protein VJV74_16075 [Terriglobia bacterium]|nr:hypothetical protein [Terriglobia bacterium]